LITNNIKVMATSNYFNMIIIVTLHICNSLELNFEYNLFDYYLLFIIYYSIVYYLLFII